ncbi:MAG: glycosyltransferase family 2 protein [Acidobacteriota bacterium]
MADVSVAIIIPALNEAKALPMVLEEIPASLVDCIIVVDNGSSDETAEVARRAGAKVVREPRRGYGGACQAGLATLARQPPDVVVFLDADHSDYPQDLAELLSPIRDGEADLVCGSRVELAEASALSPHVRWGNGLATWLIARLHGHNYRDLGPFRAIRWPALQSLEMRDPAYGWNAEMQVKALQRKLRVSEVPVRYRQRVGRSKISGTVRGTLLAGSAILWTIVALRFFAAARPGRRLRDS